MRSSLKAVHTCFVVAIRQLRLVLDIPTIADAMFENAEHKKGQSRSADEARYNVSISCYMLLSRLADLSV